MEKETIQVCKIIEKDLSNYNKGKLINLFKEYLKDKRSVTFVTYYNQTVLDKEEINFSTFSYQWALHLRRHHINHLDKNYKLIKNNILTKKDINYFFQKFGIDEDGRKNKSFCCKLFHTFLPHKFIPLDNPIRNHFKLRKYDFLLCEDIIRKGYSMFISNNKEKIKLIREVLSNKEFDFFRVNELSDIRLLDMLYWYVLNRSK